MSWFNPLSDSGTHHQKILLLLSFFFFACLCWVFVMVYKPSLVGACRLLLLQSMGSLSLGLGVVAHELRCSVALGIFPDQALSPALTGRLSTTGPPVKSTGVDFWSELISPVGQKSWTDTGLRRQLRFTTVYRPPTWWLRQERRGEGSACNTGGQVPSLGRDDPLEKGMTAHSSILVWRIPWTEEPGGLQSMRSQRVWTTERLTLSETTNSWWVILYSLQIVFFFFFKFLKCLLCKPCEDNQYRNWKHLESGLDE